MRPTPPLRFLLVLAFAVVSALSSLLPANAQAQPMAATTATAATDPAITQANRRFIAEAFERWSQGGNAFFQEVLADNVVWTIVGSGPTAGTYRGRQALMERAVRPLAERLSTPIRPHVQQLWADGDHVIVQWEGSATATDGQPYRNRYVWILRLAERRAVEVTAFLDLQAYAEVLRRVPAPAPRP